MVFWAVLNALQVYLAVWILGPIIRSLRMLLLVVISPIIKILVQVFFVPLADCHARLFKQIHMKHK